MAKYRIRIESLDPAEELRAEYRMGMECDGFAIITNIDEGEECKHNYAMSGMSINELSYALANEPDMLTAAIIARGIAEAEEVTRRARGDKMMARLIDGATRRMEDDGK